MSLVLVTGGAGFIGSHLVEALLARSYRVRVVDNLFQGDRANLPQNDDLEFIEGDVTDYATCEAAAKDVEGIFHLAAMSKVAPSLESPDMLVFCTEQNAIGTANVLNAALANRSSLRKFVYSGSSTYYGGNPTPNAEDQPHGCQTPYAVTKYVGELFTELYARLHGLPTIRLRYFMTYGPREPSTGPYAVVTGVFMKQWAQNQPLTILGDGLQTRDFIHVHDVAEGIVRAFESSAEDATINLGTGQALSIKALADLISPDHTYLAPREHDIPHSQADTGRMRSILGWEPRTDIVKYVKSLIRERVAANPGKYPEPGWLVAERANAN